jgi:hypothetical protein
VIKVSHKIGVDERRKNTPFKRQKRIGGKGYLKSGMI